MVRMGLFCESVSVAASMAAPDEKVLSESTTTEEFTNTLASWLRFSLCSCSHFLNCCSSSVTTQHNKQQQRENLLGKAGLQPLPAIVPSLGKVLSWFATLSRKIARERSLCSLSQFSNDTGRRSRLLPNTQKETFPLLMYFFCVVFFVVFVVVFRLSTPRDRQINEIFPFSTKFF